MFDRTTREYAEAYRIVMTAREFGVKLRPGRLLKIDTKTLAMSACAVGVELIERIGIFPTTREAAAQLQEAVYRYEGGTPRIPIREAAIIDGFDNRPGIAASYRNHPDFGNFPTYREIGRLTRELAESQERGEPVLPPIVREDAAVGEGAGALR